MWSIFSVLGGTHKCFFRETQRKDPEKLCSKENNCSLSTNTLGGADHHSKGNTLSTYQKFYSL